MPESPSCLLRHDKDSEGLFSSALKKGTAALLPFSRKEQPKSYGSLYSNLLQNYLEHFLPRDRHAMDQKWVGGTARGSRPSIGSVFLGTLQEFWLTDVLEPIPKGLTLKTAVTGIQAQLQDEYQRAVRWMKLLDARASLDADHIFCLVHHAPSYVILEGGAWWFEKLGGFMHSLQGTSSQCAQAFPASFEDLAAIH